MNKNLSILPIFITAFIHFQCTPPVPPDARLESKKQSTAASDEVSPAQSSAIASSKPMPAPSEPASYPVLPNAPKPETLLEKMDGILRGSSHDMTVTLDVRTKSWERYYRLRVRMKGVDYAFARVLEPAKSEGQGFLRIKERLWNYLPTAERTVLIPPSMMLDKFMGSDFSNDDFVKLSYLPRDYDGIVTGEETLDGHLSYRLELTPRPEAPVIYGRLRIWLRKSDAAPVRLEFYNEKMAHIRTLHYSAFRNFGGHEVPSVWKMENLKERERETTVTILEASFGISIDDALFTRENLEKYP